MRVETGHSESVVFINNIRHGTANEQGILELKAVKAGSYPVRVRSVGFVDWKGRVSVAAGGNARLVVPTRPAADQATLHYQRGDQLRDKANNPEAVEAYKEALKLRSVFPEARIGMARSLITLERYDEGENQLREAMKQGRATLAEAQTVLANLRRSQALIDESIEEYRKALRLAANNSPEAHIGLALALQEAGEQDAAIREYRIGIAQDMDTEPILYYLLGSALEKFGRKKEAIEAYSSYLRLDPEGQYSSAVESMIEQIKEELGSK